MMEELFKKAVPARLKSNDRDERQVAIGVSIILNTVSTPVHKKELLIRLTDEIDPFFLYTLALGEEDFQGLKVQQGLLVDFTAFPQKLIDLLSLCLAEADKDNPKFLLQFCECSGGPSCPSLLHVVETNPFRHLNHLSLKFVPASDTYLKKYLAECLVVLKEKNSVLSSDLTNTKSDLSARLAQCEDALSKRSQELERLKCDWSSHTAALSSEHSASLNAEREKALQGQAQAQASFQQEKRALEQAHVDKVRGLEMKQQELEQSNKDLTNHKFHLEAVGREMEAKFKSAEGECAGMREELQKLRKENTSLDASSHEQDKTLTQLRTRVAVLEQELQDKEQMIGRTTELLEAAQEQKRNYEASLGQRQRQITKLDTAFKAASEEVLKGNEIIQKLQGEIRNIKSKLKLRNMVTTKQESLLGERDKALSELKQEVQSLQRSLSQQQEELSKRESEAEETKGKLEEAKEQLKTNENVISYLNKQLTSQTLGYSGGGGRVPSGVPLSSIRPSPPSLRPVPAPSSSYPALSAAQSLPQFSSTPTNGTYSTSAPLLQQYRASSFPGPAPAPGPAQHQRHVLGSLGSQENIGRQQQQQILFKGRKPSPLSEHAQVAMGVVSVGGTLPFDGKDSGITTTSPANKGEPWLDPKYLPPDPPAEGTPEQGPIPNPYSTVTPGVMKTQGVLKNGAGGARGRGRYQGDRGGAVSGRSKPASSYFPKS